jgi:hypothetical protein
MTTTYTRGTAEWYDLLVRLRDAEFALAEYERVGSKHNAEYQRAMVWSLERDIANAKDRP